MSMTMTFCKYIFILQLPEDKTKNYVGILDNEYNYSSFNFFIKSQYITKSVMKQLKYKLLSLNLTKDTQIVLSNTIDSEHPIFLFLSMLREVMHFKFCSVEIAKTFKRISTYHTSFKIGRDFQLTDYNKLYKKILANDICKWITKTEDAKISNMSRAEYRIQKFLRILMYYMCIKQYFLSRQHKIV